MQSLNQLLIDTLGPLGPLIAVGALGFLLVLVTLPFLLKKNDDPLDRLKAQVSKTGDQGRQGPPAPG